jgi:signal peptidase I
MEAGPVAKSNTVSQSMKAYSHQSRYKTLLVVFLTVIFWMAVAPTQLGGRLTYVIVNGNSMEPRFHLGDLIIVRKAANYQVGDAVTYQNSELNNYVFHRIINTELDRFILQGDNNSWIDSYQPNREEIIGKLWVHIPYLGKAIEWIRAPINLAIVVAIFGGILMAGMIQPASQQSKAKNKPFNKNIGGTIEGAFIVIGIFALAFLSLGIFAFTRPITRTADSIQYQQEGSFFYSAAGTPGVYDTETVRVGEPIFPGLTCQLNVGFTYSLLGGQAEGTSGSHQLYARILDEQSGWQRTIPLVSETAFGGNSYSTLAPVDLCQVESIVNMVEQETGLNSNLYTLEIISHITMTSNISGIQINDTFEPSLVFRFDKVHFFLASNNEGTDSFHTIKAGVANNSQLQVNTISILGWKISVQTVRGISLLGLGLALGASLIPGWYLFVQSRQNQEALIRFKYGGLLMDIFEGYIEPTRQIIDVASIDDLAKLAERQNTMILHMRLNFLHYYMVQVNGTTYRHLISTGKKGIIEVESIQQQISDYAPNPSEYSLAGAGQTRKEIPYFIVNDYETQPVRQGQCDVQMLRKIKI